MLFSEPPQEELQTNNNNLSNSTLRRKLFNGDINRQEADTQHTTITALCRVFMVDVLSIYSKNIFEMWREKKEKKFTNILVKLILIFSKRTKIRQLLYGTIKKYLVGSNQRGKKFLTRNTGTLELHRYLYAA